MRTSQLVLRGALVVAMLPFTTAASCDGGYRADIGSCPDGEACSASTPDGLHFQGGVIGEGFLDLGQVKTTALGGTQEVQLETEDDAGIRSPFLLPHDVEVTSATLAVEGAVDDQFTLRGMAVGDALVRVVDPATGELFDRIDASVLPLASITSQTTLNMLFATSPEPAGSSLLYAPGATGYIRLAAANNTSLVDTSSHITGAGVTQTGWDRFVVGNLPVGSHTFTVTAGTETTVTLPFEVAIPDTIAGGPTALTKGEPTLACFVARRGTSPVHTHFDSYTATGATTEPSTYEGCVTITPTVVGTVTLHVTASGLAKDLVITSTAPTSSSRLAPSNGPRGTAGERAAIRSTSLAASR